MNQPVTEPKRSRAGCLTTAFVIFLLVSCARIARFGPRIMDELIPPTPLPQVYMLPPSTSSGTPTPRLPPAVALTVSAFLEKHNRLPAQLVGQPTATPVVTVAAAAIGPQQPERLGKVNGAQPVQGKPTPTSTVATAEYVSASGHIEATPPYGWDVQLEENGYVMWNDPERWNAIVLRWIEGYAPDLDELSDQEFLEMVQKFVVADELEVGDVVHSPLTEQETISVDLSIKRKNMDFRSVLTAVVLNDTLIFVESMHLGDQDLRAAARAWHAQFLSSLRVTQPQAIDLPTTEPNAIPVEAVPFTRQVEPDSLPVSVAIPTEWIMNLDADGQVGFANAEETIFWVLSCSAGKDIRLYDMDDATIEEIVTHQVLIGFESVGPIQVRRSNSFGLTAVSVETTIIDGSDTFQTQINLKRVGKLNCTAGFYRAGIATLTDPERRLADQLADSVEPQP